MAQINDGDEVSGGTRLSDGIDDADELSTGGTDPIDSDSDDDELTMVMVPVE